MHDWNSHKKAHLCISWFWIMPFKMTFSTLSHHWDLVFILTHPHPYQWFAFVNYSCLDLYEQSSLLSFAELGQLSGIAAILRFPIAENEEEDSDENWETGFQLPCVVDCWLILFLASVHTYMATSLSIHAMRWRPDTSPVLYCFWFCMLQQIWKKVWDVLICWMARNWGFRKVFE